MNPLMNQQYMNYNNSISPNQSPFITYNASPQIPQNNIYNSPALNPVTYQQQISNAQLIQQQLNNTNIFNNMCLNMMVNQTQNLIKELNNLHSNYQPLKLQYPSQYPSQQQQNIPQIPQQQQSQPQQPKIQPITRENNQFNSSSSSINSINSISSTPSDYRPNDGRDLSQMKKFLRWIIY